MSVISKIISKMDRKAKAESEGSTVLNMVRQRRLRANDKEAKQRQAREFTRKRLRDVAAAGNGDGAGSSKPVTKPDLQRSPPASVSGSDRGVVNDKPQGNKPKGKSVAGATGTGKDGVKVKRTRRKSKGATGKSSKPADKSGK